MPEGLTILSSDLRVGYRERRISAPDGLQLYLRDYGDPLSTAAPVLCLSGLLRNSKDFHPLASRLARTRRVVCPDYRGRGRSDYDKNWRNYSPETHLTDTLALIQALGLHRCVVCGTSFGGLLAMGVAAAAPILLSGAILNDIGPDLGARGLERVKAYSGKNRSEPDWATATRRVQEMFPDLGLEGPGMWRRFAEATYTETADGWLRVDWDTNAGRGINGALPDLWALYRSLGRIPTLAIRGEQSDILLPETFARMGAEKPDLRQLVLAGKGHAPTLDEPAAIASIDSFLTEIDSARSD